MSAGGRSRIWVFAAWVAGVGLVGLVAASLLPGSPEGRKAALVGVGEAVFSGWVALELKRRALARSLNWALGMMGVVFALRLVLVAMGLVVVLRAGLPAAAFTVGFFAVYFVLQWVEVAYVLAEGTRRGQGGE